MAADKEITAAINPNNAPIIFRMVQSGERSIVTSIFHSVFENAKTVKIDPEKFPSRFPTPHRLHYRR